MPSVHQILQCFQCRTFQVQIAKKKPKWQCKICNEKQSVKKIFMQSESAKDCRLMVQDLNLNKANLDNSIKENFKQLQELVDHSKYSHILETTNHKPYNETNKWIQFLDKDSSNVSYSSVEALNQDMAFVYSGDHTDDSNSESDTQHQHKRKKWDEIIQETVFSMETKIHCKKEVGNLTDSIGIDSKNENSNLKVPAKHNIFEYNVEDLDLNF